MKIAVLGAGAYGSVLGDILVGNGYEVSYYDVKNKETSLEKAILDADSALITVPSLALASVLWALPKDLSLIVATKGILDEKIFDEFLAYEVISGAGYAAEIQKHKPTVLTSTSREVAEFFATSYLSFDFTDDKRGVLLCGALKNIYAILAGLMKLERGTVKWNNYIAAVVEEMKSILRANGADPNTVNLSCGEPDLRLTCGLPSRNYEYGMILRTSGQAQPEKTVEGLSAIREIKAGAIRIPDEANYLKRILEEICH